MSSSAIVDGYGRELRFARKVMLSIVFETPTERSEINCGARL